MHKRWAILVLVLLGICTITTIAEAGTEVTWYFKDTNVSGFSHPSGHIFDKFMNRTEVPTGTANYTVTLGPGERAWWYANEAAECDLTFHTGEWKATYWANTNSNNAHRIYVRLYVVKEDGTPNLISEKWNTLKYHDSPKKKERPLPTNSSTHVNKGERIALEIQWSPSADSGDTLTIYYNSTSYKSKLISPPDHHPIPEFPTLALPLAIVLGIVFFLFRGKREKNKEVQ